MVKIAHEAPKSIFRKVQQLTDYDYALVHLFEEDKEYLELFKESIKGGREVILDNSIFELGEAFNMEKFVSWVKEIKPSWYIVPDSLENMKVTIKNMKRFINLGYKEECKDSGCIGVIQGKTWKEIVKCYNKMVELNVDMIAIPFDLSYYEKTFPHKNRLVSWMLGRVKLIGDLKKKGVLKENKKHHLLGCALPQEGMYYEKESWLYSMDTSNPVVHGIVGIDYVENQGLKDKVNTKLYTLMNKPEVNWSKVERNVKLFENMWKD